MTFMAICRCPTESVASKFCFPFAPFEELAKVKLLDAMKGK